jgi:heat shock protein HslJ
MRFVPLLLVAACGSPTSGERWDQVLGAEWVLWKIEDKPVLEGAGISLTFGTGRLYGQAVNRYGAAYNRTDDALTIQAVGATKKHIDNPPGAMDQEARYLKLLGEADGWTHGHGWLMLKSAGRTTLSFKRRESTSRG